MRFDPSPRFVTTALLVAAAAALPSCGPPERGPVDPVQGCVEYRIAACNRYIECTAPEEGGPPSLGACLQNVDENAGTCEEAAADLALCVDGVGEAYLYCRDNSLAEKSCGELCTPNGDDTTSCNHTCITLCTDTGRDDPR